MDPFLARVLAEPHDAALRAVWADALQEAGDPRGELIALQLCPPPLTPAQDKRLRSLIAKHRGEWLAELAPIVQHREGLVFDRGVLAECQIQVKSVPAFEAAIGHPFWSTLRRVWFCDRFAWDSRIVRLLVHPAMRELREVTCIGMNNVFVALARNPTPLPFTAVWTDDDTFRNPAAPRFRDLVDAPGLPALERLGFTLDRRGTDWVPQHPLVRKISTLGITSYEDTGAWLTATRSVANLTTLESRKWWIPIQGPQRSHHVLRFTRGSGGAWSKLHIETASHPTSEMLARDLPSIAAATTLEEVTAPAELVPLFKTFKHARIIPIGEPPAPEPKPKPKATRQTATPETKKPVKPKRNKPKPAGKRTSSR